MILYHGSLEEIAVPEIRTSHRTVDFGVGFYATTSKEQAIQWVKRRMHEKHRKFGFVNCYHINISAIDSMKTLIFDKPSDEWVDFVMLNRTQNGFSHDYDIVYGLVANDRVYAQFAFFEGGLISKETLIKELKTYTLVDQYLFHTEKSLQLLSFVESEKIW